MQDVKGMKCYREHACGCPAGVGGGMVWEFGIIRCKLLYVRWINNKVLLYRRGNYSQYPVINHHGKKYGKECVCIYIYIYLYNCITLLCSRHEHNIVNQLYLNKLNFKNMRYCA